MTHLGNRHRVTWSPPSQHTNLRQTQTQPGKGHTSNRSQPETQPCTRNKLTDKPTPANSGSPRGDVRQAESSARMPACHSAHTPPCTHKRCTHMHHNAHLRGVWGETRPSTLSSEGRACRKLLGSSRGLYPYTPGRRNQASEPGLWSLRGSGWQASVWLAAPADPRPSSGQLGATKRGGDSQELAQKQEGGWQGLPRDSTSRQPSAGRVPHLSTARPCQGSSLSAQPGGRGART